MTRYFESVLSAVLVLSATQTTVAQSFSLTWYTIDTGGEMFTTGDSFELSGTIGQPDAGAMTGGTFELTGGFWAGAATAPFCLGDLDGDGFRDLSDLAQLISNYDMTGGMTYADGDLDGDGDVDLSDLAGLLSVYATPCP